MRIQVRIQVGRAVALPVALPPFSVSQIGLRFTYLALTPDIRHGPTGPARRRGPWVEKDGAERAVI